MIFHHTTFSQANSDSDDDYVPAGLSPIEDNDPAVSASNDDYALAVSASLMSPSRMIRDRGPRDEHVSVSAVC